MMRTVTGAPYSAVEVRTEQQVLSGGNVIQRQSQTTINRDSQGRVRTDTEMARTDPSTGAKTTVKRISISDPVAGMVHELDPQNKTVNSMTVRRGGGGGRGMGLPPRANNGGVPPAPSADPNVQIENLGTQTINGVSATGSRITRTIPAGQIGNAQPIQVVQERWVSEDLKVPVMVKISDPRFGTTVTQLTNITRAEPDAALFQVPSDYTVRQGPGRGPGGGRPIPRGQNQ